MRTKSKPVLSSILHEIHRRADKEWAEDGHDFTVTISAEDYKALCEEEDASEWSPIETAPKDGTPILGWDGFSQTAVEWDDYGRRPGWVLCETGAHAESNDWLPTHWTELPEPPTKPKRLTWAS